jgi:predicted DNA-binding transcriptional regulator AlpA
MSTYSTVQVARLLGITSDTLHRWIREVKVKAPSIQSLGGMRVRIWSEEQVEAVRKYKAEHYRKKPGRRKRKKSTKQ